MARLRRLMIVPMPAGLVAMMMPRGFRRNQVQVGVPHAALCGEATRELLDGISPPAQDADLKAAVVIEMHMGGGDGQIVMVVLRRDDALRQVADGMVVDIGEGRDGRRASLGGMILLRRFAQKFADRLGAAWVAPLVDQRVDGREKLIVDRDRDPFHAVLPCAVARPYEEIVFTSYPGVVIAEDGDVNGSACQRS
jgi:hypothetical protein